MVNSHCSSSSPPPRLRQRRTAPSALYSNSGACERPQSHSEWIHPDTDVDQPRKKYRWFGRYKPLPRADPECWRNTRDVDRKSTRLNSSHSQISYAVFCLKKKKNTTTLDFTPGLPFHTRA